MTARVCPVHGEYAADGVCRWCEPGPADALTHQWFVDRRNQAIEDLLGPPPVPTYMGAPVVVDRSVSRFADAPPMLVNWGPTEKTEDAYVTRLEWTGLHAAKILRTYKPEFLNRIGFTTIYLPTAADLPIQPPVVLEYQHAALRWERVARRWATKAKFDGHETTVDGTLVFDDRCAECRRTKRLTEAGIPKEWP